MDHISYVSVVTVTAMEHHRSVRSSCVIERFDSILLLLRPIHYFFEIYFCYKGVCQRTGLDILPFLLYEHIYMHSFENDPVVFME